MEPATHSALFPILGVLGFIVVFPIFWCGVVGLISVIGGWRTLAAHYAVPTFGGTVLSHATTGRLGLANYRNVLKVGWSEQGLHLGVMVFFRPFHPPLCIPWQDVTRRTQGKFLFFAWDMLEVQGVKVALVTSLLAPIAAKLPPVSAA